MRTFILNIGNFMPLIKKICEYFVKHLNALCFLITRQLIRQKDQLQVKLSYMTRIYIKYSKTLIIYYLETNKFQIYLAKPYKKRSTSHFILNYILKLREFFILNLIFFFL